MKEALPTDLDDEITEKSSLIEYTEQTLNPNGEQLWKYSVVLEMAPNGTVENDSKMKESCSSLDESSAMSGRDHTTGSKQSEEPESTFANNERTIAQSKTDNMADNKSVDAVDEASTRAIAGDDAGNILDVSSLGSAGDGSVVAVDEASTRAVAGKDAGNTVEVSGLGSAAAGDRSDVGPKVSCLITAGDDADGAVDHKTSIKGKAGGDAGDCVSESRVEIEPKVEEDTVSQLSSIEGDMCRICHCMAEESETLISPCDCRGSMKWVHQKCLQKWVKARDAKKCELCGFLFDMTSSVKPFRKWKKLDMSSVERRRILCSVTFHIVAITCVIWSLYVLIERTTQEIQDGQLNWPFWTKLVVVAIGFTGGLVFMYVQCKTYVKLFRRWKQFNRVIYINDIQLEVTVIMVQDTKADKSQADENTTVVQIPEDEEVKQTVL